MSDPTSTEAEVDPVNDPQRAKELALLKAAIGRGFDVEAFMRTDIGMYFRMKASREVEEAQEALTTVNFRADPASAEELQLQARVAQRVLTWFADAVAEGEAAEQRMQQVFDEGHPD